MIYFDNAATTRIDERVLEVVYESLKNNYGNPSSQHGLGRRAADAVLEARDNIARLLGCASQQVYFVSGGTEAGNWALKGACAVNKGKHIVLSAIEHPALIESAEDMKKLGYKVTLVYPDESGIINPQDVQKALTDDTVFCAVMHANNEVGTIQPVEEIGKLCRDRGVFYYCDCVQTAGVLPLPVEFCDAIGLSAHKFYGPKGVGALVLKNGAHIARLISGGKQERGLRGGTTNTAGIVGMSTALNLAYAEMEKNNAHTVALRDRFIDGVLKNIQGTHLNGDKGKRLPANANISFDGCDGENILFLLDLKGIAVSTGSACSAGAVTLSHVLTAMGYEKERAKGAVRFTFGKYNTFEEVDMCLDILGDAIARIRKSKTEI
jgi:cysteine desulfurase